MFATFAIEMMLVLYVVVRYKMSTLTRLIVSALIFLGMFQFAEYFVCTGTTAYGENLARLGNIAITTLPPLGIHIVHEIAGKKSPNIIRFAYATGLAFIAFFAFSESVFSYYGCGGNYALFNLVAPINYFYGVFYYGWLFYGVYLCQQLSKTAKPRIKQALTYQAYGYISFILPTGIVNLINPSTISGIPSIMCGFAVIYALLLAIGITPLVLKERREAKGA